MQQRGLLLTFSYHFIVIAVNMITVANMMAFSLTGRRHLGI